ncbi:hypothetical protein KOI35_10275 [Actinoplanes bogorensis]|uniref:Dyp-type peroxidase family n=1 Tax=Paractinoplanes bogorensis TaxID=1610840 RepID=A0ABS5YM91_9ACTN|nr:hypothetical protein [Actinoplanes bogorensis]MBU2663874.1 hypothetical protein [Actinoplanes bogorensis]
MLTAADLKGELDDIQPNVVTPIKMRCGRHIFVHFDDGEAARRWLAAMLEAARRPEHFTINLGLTYAGLTALGMSREALDSFPQAFREGPRARAARLGDVGVHAPEHWEGGLGGPDIHALVLVRTPTEQARELATRILRDGMRATGGVTVRFVQDTDALVHEDGTGAEGEHFGFVDPISNPPVEGNAEPSYAGDGVLEPDGSWRAVKPGEFLLGYEDEVGETISGPEPFDLKRNGTFLVFRKLRQDVAGFRRFVATTAARLYGSDARPDQDRVAAKMMGRWPSGCPVDLSPDHDDPSLAHDLTRRNDFTYEGDDEGRRCPLGAHLRRSNPRATPLARNTVVQRHRLIRRSVEYGPLVPDDVIEDDGVDRGLCVLIINADIERQFEFVQSEWLKGGSFMGLDPAEQDPILGDGGPDARMTVPGTRRPVLFDLPAFTATRGAEYLFVPGLSALRGIIDRRF